jgi:hypothetical protein
MDGLGHFFVLLSTSMQIPLIRSITDWNGTWSYLLAYPISVHIARHGTGGDS